MKKILVLFNGISAPWHITTFALNMAKSNNAGLHVLFLKDEVSDYPYPSDIASVQKSYSAKTEKEDNKKLEEKNIALFKTFCDDKKVACQFERDVSLKNLVNFIPGEDIIIRYSYDNIFVGVP